MQYRNANRADTTSTPTLTRADRLLADRLARRVRAQLDDARRVARLPVRRDAPAVPVPCPPSADHVLDRVADRLLEVLAGEADQPLPFDRSAGRVERATDEAARRV